MDCEQEEGMDKKKIVGTDKSTGDAASASKNYINSEESLLEQIRAKEEEQNARIEASRQQYITDVEYALKEAESRISRERSLGQTEADSVWREAMDRINSDVERILGEGEQMVRLDRERKEQRFNGVVERVVREIGKG
jgi:multidrug resistance efflux pump